MPFNKKCYQNQALSDNLVQGTLGARLFKKLLFVSGIVVVALFSSRGQAATGDFGKWLKELRVEARQKGISQEVIAEALPDSLRPIEKIIQLDRKQPEKTKSFDAYLNQIVSKDRILMGKAKIDRYRPVLSDVSSKYNVDKEAIVALWGIETNFGQNTGSYDVINALATLAYDGRRSAYFREELFKALRILDENHIRHADMKGSWAGAMGQSQFMPSSFLRFAVDHDADGRRDIWTTEADVFASAANYLAQNGWKAGAPWGRKVKLTKPIDAGLMGVSIKKPLQFWHDAGVRLQSGEAVPFEGAYQASLVQPGGTGMAAYIVYDNYRTIMAWNKSIYFATAVGTLADSLKDHGGSGRAVVPNG